MFDQKQVLDSLFDGLYTVTRMRRITYWNKAAEEISGYTAEEMVGCHCYDSPLKHVDKEGNDLCQDGCPLSWAMAHKTRHEDEIFLRHKDGFRVPINVRVAPLYDANGQVEGASELFRDHTPTDVITQRLAELEELSMIDPLTKLANEKYAFEVIHQYLQEMQRHPIHVGVALFKIDHQDDLVKKHGPKAFDALQVVAGQTLERNSRPLDLVSRINEGMFLCVFRNISENHLYAACEKMRLLFAKSNVDEPGASIKGTFSIGGHCLKAKDTREDVVALCSKHILDCQNEGGNQSKIDIRFVAS